MRYIHCPWNRRIRCYESNNRTCPLAMRGWMEIVDRWALTGRTPRSLDTSAVLGGINIGGSEVLAVRAANIHQMFQDPDSVIGWVVASSEGRAQITAGICEDLKRGYRRWKAAKAERVKDNLSGYADLASLVNEAGTF